MNIVHVRFVYEVPKTNRDDLRNQCSRLMETLLQLEDKTVYDAAVSMDAREWHVEVEVTAEGRDYDTAAERARNRIADAVRTVTVEMPEIQERHSERIPA